MHEERIGGIGKAPDVAMPARPRRGWKRIRVFIVDDSLTMRAMLATLFEADERFTVVGTAASVEEARELLPRRLPDVMTLDDEMPGMSGMDFLREIAVDEMLPVVMVSVHLTEDAAGSAEALAVGAYACFDKAKLLRDARHFTRLVADAAHGRRRPGAPGARQGAGLRARAASGAPALQTPAAAPI